MKQVQVMIRTPDSPNCFRCECKCNVFRKIKLINGEVVYRCNVCGATYVNEVTNKSSEKEVK